MEDVIKLAQIADTEQERLTWLDFCKKELSELEIKFQQASCKTCGPARYWGHRIMQLRKILKYTELK